MTATALHRRDSTLVIAGAGLVIAAAIALHAMGHPWICTCGTIELWHGSTPTSENSQHLFDWYTASHVIHGFFWYFVLWLFARHLPLNLRAFAALVLEVGWELFENSPFIIERYRATTISVDYFGDSVINSLADIAAMLLGFFIAARLPVWLTIVIFVAMEVIAAAVIRDNITLNIIMLIYPIEAIKAWQEGG